MKLIFYILIRWGNKKITGTFSRVASPLIYNLCWSVVFLKGEQLYIVNVSIGNGGVFWNLDGSKKICLICILHCPKYTVRKKVIDNKSWLLIGHNFSKYGVIWLVQYTIHVTSFSVFHTEANSKKQSASNLSFILPQLKQGRKVYNEKYKR